MPSVTTGALLRKQNVSVPKQLTAETKYFRVPHPLYSDKDLVHAAIESNRHLVSYSGIVDLLPFQRKITLMLPEYFHKLVRPGSISVILQPINSYQPVTYRINNTFEVEICRPVFWNSVSVAYTVTAERNDVAPLEEVVDRHV
jgi:hypothetical protein